MTAPPPLDRPSVPPSRFGKGALGLGSAGPLAGLRVLDFTWAMAGPYCTLQLGLLGAEVIKIETMSSLDGMRRGIYALDGDLERSPTFNSLNLNKLSLRLNLKNPDSLALFRGLAAASDIVVENFRPGVLKRMGLSYESLIKHNPTIIVASSSAFGAEGPESAAAGYASIFNAMSSLGHLTGYPEGPPAELRDSIDLRVGTALTYAILAAVFHRRRTGRGQYIDVSSMEAIAALIGHTIVGYGLTGRPEQRQGNAEPHQAPHGVFPCLGDDLWVSIVAGSDLEFRSLCEAMGRPELAQDPRYADGYHRKLNEPGLNREIEGWTRRHTPAEATAILQARGVAALPVYTTKDLAEDAHVRARGAWHQVKHPRLGPQTVQALPWKSSEPWPEVRRHGPLLGQDNEYILKEVLGLPRPEIERMAETGAFN